MTLMGNVELHSTIGSGSWMTLIAAVMLTLLVGGVRGRCFGTTLSAPCVWAILSALAMLVLSAVDLAYPARTAGVDAVRLAVIATTFCPIMAVLGAKRPQDRGWQWIVLSLWAVAVWPVAQAMLLPTGSEIALPVVWKIFFVGLVALGPLNYLLTRNGIASLLVAAGQILLLDPFLWKLISLSDRQSLLGAMACFLAARWAVTLPRSGSLRLSDASRSASLEDYEQQWRDFRDAFGAFWGLRVLARVNETAHLRGWPVRLGWSGFEGLSEDARELSAEQLSEIEQSLSTLLRRFFASGN